MSANQNKIEEKEERIKLIWQKYQHSDQTGESFRSFIRDFLECTEINSSNSLCDNQNYTNSLEESLISVIVEHLNIYTLQCSEALYRLSKTSYIRNQLKYECNIEKLMQAFSDSLEKQDKLEKLENERVLENLSNIFCNLFDPNENRNFILINQYAKSTSSNNTGLRCDNRINEKLKKYLVVESDSVIQLALLRLVYCCIIGNSTNATFLFKFESAGSNLSETIDDIFKFCVKFRDAPKSDDGEDDQNKIRMKIITQIIKIKLYLYQKTDKKALSMVFYLFKAEGTDLNLLLLSVNQVLGYMFDSDIIFNFGSNLLVEVLNSKIIKGRFFYCLDDELPKVMTIFFD